MDPVAASTGVIESCARLELSDEWSRLKIALEPSGAPSFWRFPLETASQSESGFERTYQGSVLAPVWPLRLQAGQTFETSLSIDVGTLES
jgi:alpha-amylase